MMEYLLTYGVALLVILLVLAIIAVLVLPSLTAGENCQFREQGFGCSTKKHVIVADDVTNNVRVIFQLDNQQGRAVDIKGVVCTNEPPANVQRDQITGGCTGRLAAGATMECEAGCVDVDANPVTLTPNSNFDGSIGIKYNYQDEVSGAPERMAVATLTGKVQAE